MTCFSPLSPTHKAGRRIGLRCGDMCFDSGHPRNVQQGLLQQNEEDLCVHQHKQVITTQSPAQGWGVGVDCHPLTITAAWGIW